MPHYTIRTEHILASAHFDAAMKGPEASHQIERRHRVQESDTGRKVVQVQADGVQLATRGLNTRLLQTSGVDGNQQVPRLVLRQPMLLDSQSRPASVPLAPRDLRFRQRLRWASTVRHRGRRNLHVRGELKFLAVLLALWSLGSTLPPSSSDRLAAVGRVQVQRRAA